MFEKFLLIISSNIFSALFFFCSPGIPFMCMLGHLVLSTALRCFVLFFYHAFFSPSVSLWVISVDLSPFSSSLALFNYIKSDKITDKIAEGILHLFLNYFPKIFIFIVSMSLLKVPT